MKIPKLTKGDIVAIEWTDTNIPKQAGWMSATEHKEWTDACGDTVLTVGIFTHASKQFIHLVGDWDADEVLEKEVLRPINVAKGFIKKIDILKRRKK